MSKRKKKRGGGRSPYEGYETEVWGSSPIQIAAIERNTGALKKKASKWAQRIGSRTAESWTITNLR